MEKFLAERDLIQRAAIEAARKEKAPRKQIETLKKTLAGTIEAWTLFKKDPDRLLGRTPKS